VKLQRKKRIEQEETTRAAALEDEVTLAHPKTQGRDKLLQGCLAHKKQPSPRTLQ